MEQRIPNLFESDESDQEEENPGAYETSQNDEDTASAAVKPVDLFTDQLISDMLNCHLDQPKGVTKNVAKEINKPQQEPIGDPPKAKFNNSDKNAPTQTSKPAQSNNQNQRRIPDGNGDPPIDQPTALPKGCLAQVGKLYNADGTAYIKRRQSGDPANGVLLYSGKFRSGGVLWKLHGDSALLTSTNRYIAQVSIQQVDSLDHATTFQKAKQQLEKHLRIGRVLVDEQLQNIQIAVRSYERHLANTFNDTLDNLQNAEDLLQLFNIIQMGGNDNRIVAAIKANRYISEQTKMIICEFAEQESKMITRSKAFNFLQSVFRALTVQTWADILRKYVIEGIRRHRCSVEERCPPIMKQNLGILKDKSTLFLSGHDLKLFSDLQNGLENEMFRSVLPVLIKNFMNKFTKLNFDRLTGVVPITNKIYYFLCKSLSDISEEIKSKSITKNFLRFHCEGWTLSNGIKWQSIPSTLDICLERQLKILLSMLHHFEPGRTTARHRFPYEFQIFRNVESTTEYQEAIKQANDAFGNANKAVLPDELRVWICLLDNTIAQVFSSDQKNAQLFSCLLKLYMNFSLSGNMKMDSLETLRVITHNTLRFLASTGATVGTQNALDGEILLKQIGFINWATTEGKMSLLNYRDLVEVFAQYWKRRKEVIDALPAKLEAENFKQDLKDVQNLLLKLMNGALEKKVELPELVDFCRVYDELLTDFNDLPLDWFVRLPQKEYLEIFLAKGTLAIVDNKWKDGELKCYRVTNATTFVKLYKTLYENDEMPKHYMMNVVINLFMWINSLSEKKIWESGRSLSPNDQINATSLLISSVRSSLLYLKEQPDYVSFQRFFDESTSSFHAVCRKSTSLVDFEKRVNLIKESFWFIRNQSAIDIDTALSLCRVDKENNFAESFLRLEYQKYHTQFENYLNENVDMTFKSRIQHIVSDVKSKTKQLQSSQWYCSYKEHTLPVILAGLGAVWSLLVSQDVASSGQYLKPHCIQIICVLRLLGADKCVTGVKSHLAQVLTGQGKSLVLAMVASVMALTGHSVKILCYSKYLAQRDAQDFRDFYNRFSIQSSVTYQTFDAAAAEQFAGFFTIAENYILNCLGMPPTKFLKNVSDRKNPVLLIDEVDVFFSENLYGTTYNRGTFVKIAGLGQVQIKIWELANTHAEFELIRQALQIYLFNTSYKLSELTTLLHRTNSYTIFDRDGSGAKTFTNHTLIWKHLDNMIVTALAVKIMVDSDATLQKYRINDRGDITYREKFGSYSDRKLSGYYNTFVYFRLKKSGFEEKQYNYGYLKLRMGSISYAKLPESYPLILGVTGTLTSLDRYEKEVVQQHYQILESSLMPSFFGGCNLQFNESKNFTCIQTSISWMNYIFGRISTTINANRSVLVIFDTDVTIEAFKRQFASHLDRLNVLTIDSKPKDKERIINDAGVARTITLATREMGRGVDYKSSVAVEKAGGLHVIQTFFSLDVKEETQIKGRTARKDNRGSYELIVCREDLDKLKLVEGYYDGSYRHLDSARLSLANKNSCSRKEKLLEANERHEKTIGFYENLGFKMGKY